MHTERRKSPVWVKVLKIWIALLLLAGLALCVFLYRYLAVYEKTRPEYAVESLLAEGYESVRDRAASSVDPSLYPFEDIRTLYLTYCGGYIDSNALTYRENIASRTENSAEYTVYAGSSKLCRVRVEQSGGKQLGRSLWAVTGISVEDVLGSLESTAVSIITFRGTPVYLNGVRVEENYIQEDPEDPEDPKNPENPEDSGDPGDPGPPEEKKILPELTEFEKSLSSAPEPVKYVIPAIYGDISVAGEDGTEINPEINPEISPETDPGTGADAERVYYVLPEKHDLVIEAPEDVTVSVGGRTLSPATDAEPGDGIFEDLTEFTGTPYYRTAVYRISGLYTSPEVTAKDGNGNVLQPRISDGTYRFYYISDGLVKDSMKEYVRTFFEAYMEYSANGSKGDRYGNLMNKLRFGTPLHSYVVNSYEAMQWASSSELTYRYLTMDNFHMVNQNCFTCTVDCSIDVKSTSWVEESESDLTGTWQIVMVSSGPAWVAAAVEEIT